MSELIAKTNRKGTLYYVNNDDVIVSKACAVCGGVKELGEYQKHKAGLGGMSSTCKCCRRGYYNENKDKFAERYELNRYSIRQQQRIYYESNKERFQKYAKEYYVENKEHNREYNENYRKLNKEYYTVYKRNWRRNNPEKDVLISQRRRARKISLIDDLTKDELEFTLDYFGGCALTGDTEGLHLDHVVAISTGNGGTTLGNMIPLRADLNISKSDNNIFEWFKANRQRFKLSQTRFDNLITWLSEVNGMTTEEYRSFVYMCHDNSKEKEAILCHV